MTPRPAPVQLTQTLHTYGAAIAPVAHAARTLQQYKQTHGKPAKLAKNEALKIQNEIERLELAHIRGGVNFSRVQVDELLRAREDGEIIEFETLGPYLADYVLHDGVMHPSHLVPEDSIGLELARVFRQLFPNGRLIALCDDYNDATKRSQPPQQPSVGALTGFSAVQKTNFKTSLVALFESVGAISSSAQHNEYLLIDESAKTADAALLVDMLETRGHIERSGQEIIFTNVYAENPLYQTFTLRTKQGRWLCEALDAAAFIKPHNTSIAHIIVLPSYMKTQQDKVWELLRLIGIFPHKYHNIFYDPNHDPAEVAMTIQALFAA